MSLMPPAFLAPQHCDLLIVGAGPAGLAAGLAAASKGSRVVIVDDNPAPGGQIWRDGPGATLPALAQQLRADVARHSNISVLCGTRVVALGQRLQHSDAPSLVLENAEGSRTQHCGRLLLCTGARELLLPFPGWTLPGVTGAGGLQALIKAGTPVRGQRVVVAGTGPLLLAAADAARKGGAAVVRVAEHSGWADLARFAAKLARWPGKATQALALWTPALRAAAHVLEARGDGGDLASVRLRVGSREEEIDCDRLACGFGLVPNTHLGQMLGCAPGPHGGLKVDERMATSVPGVFAAGECTGFGGSERALAQGAIAGLSASSGEPPTAHQQRTLARWNAFSDALREHFPLRAAALAQLPRDDTLVCRCEDVAHGVLRQRSGWIDAKLHTRCGMGACQGRICGAASQVLYGWQPMPGRHLLAPARFDTLASAPAGAPTSPSHP